MNLRVSLHQDYRTSQTWCLKAVQSGRVEGKRETARNMKLKGFDVLVIAEITGISKEEVEKLWTLMSLPANNVFQLGSTPLSLRLQVKNGVRLTESKAFGALMRDGWMIGYRV